MLPLQESACVICRQAIDSSDPDVAEVSKGLDRLIEYSDKYNDTDLKTYLMSKPVTVRVHNSCHRRYTSKGRFAQATCNTHSSGESVQQKLLRSATNAFNWKEHCFFSAVLYAMIPISTSVAL